MICKFCHRQSSPSDLPIFKNRGISIFFCFPCNSEYLVHSGYPHKDYINLYHNYNNFLYKFSIHSSASYLYQINSPGKPGKSFNKDIHLIKSFDSFLNISPDNINEKLQSYLVFI